MLLATETENEIDLIILFIWVGNSLKNAILPVHKTMIYFTEVYGFLLVNVLLAKL